MTEQSSFSTATTWSERFPTRAFSVSVADHIRALEESRSAFLVTKRIVDLLLGSVLLVFATPIILAAMLLIWFTDRGPALFVQERVGHRCQPFRMLKLRTMQIGSERDEEKLLRRRSGSIFLKIKDDPRVTPFGYLLRWSSIDELPQLINVLRGDMSLIGPRPLLLCDLRRFPQSEQLRRFAMKPGLTGLWQVSGRSRLSDAERMKLDLEYVDGWGLWRDTTILARTIPAVLSGRGAV